VQQDKVRQVRVQEWSGKVQDGRGGACGVVAHSQCRVLQQTRGNKCFVTAARRTSKIAAAAKTCQLKELTSSAVHAAALTVGACIATQSRSSEFDKPPFSVFVRLFHNANPCVDSITLEQATSP
jgi:hypothetical protein